MTPQKITQAPHPGKAPHRAAIPQPTRSIYDDHVTAAHLAVKETRTGDEAVLVLTGEIDIATASSLREAAQRAIAPPLARLVLDFAGVTFCDSQGLATLIAINKEVQAVGGRLLIINVGEFMDRLLDVTGLRAAFEVKPA
jgi:anti-anti-sigma factor